MTKIVAVQRDHPASPCAIRFETDSGRGVNCVIASAKRPRNLVPGYMGTRVGRIP